MGPVRKLLVELNGAVSDGSKSLSAAFARGWCCSLVADIVVETEQDNYRKAYK